ncbi:MAG: LacI family transcriptional regulator, partial [Clostridiales bacterium]|nr:LacI family transcriptional regulator [Clostridiales bacterium]
MKRTIALILSLLLLVSFVGCASTGGENVSDGNPS